MKKRTIKLVLLIAFIAVALLSTRYLGLGKYLDEQVLREWIEGFGVWGPLVYILIYSIAPTLMLPGLPITVIGGILFGPLWGVIYVSIGSTIGATIAFLVARYMGREWVAAFVKGRGKRWEDFEGDVERQGWKVVAFTRLIPLFPFNVLNYAFGLTSVRLSHYVAASFVFMMPAIVAYVVFSSSLLDLINGKVSKEFLIGLALVIVVSLIPIIYKKKKAGRSGGIE